MIFVDFRSVVHFKYLPPGQIVITVNYLSVSKRLRDAVILKQPELCSNISWILQSGNLPSDRGRIVLDYLTKHQEISPSSLRILWVWRPVAFSSCQNSNYLFWGKYLYL